MGTQVKNPPYGLVADAPLATQRGEEASVDDRRAARPADDRNDVGRRAPLDLLDQLVDEALAAEEQARVLLSERQEAAIRRQAREKLLGRGGVDRRALRA